MHLFFLGKEGGIGDKPVSQHVIANPVTFLRYTENPLIEFGCRRISLQVGMLFDLYETLERLGWERLADVGEQPGATAVLQILRYRLTRLVRRGLMALREASHVSFNGIVLAAQDMVKSRQPIRTRMALHRPTRGR